MAPKVDEKAADKVEKFYMNRAGKRVEVDMNHLRKPHTLEPRKFPMDQNPLVMGGDHRPSAEPSARSSKETEN
ncbi:LANO_0F10704g1_1 [Lachancea nothofagi CBS 11611]|uniref:LANO_0F10704g1_1 n=1 Tax=Lachancea nothofagi CBS 11611 TaxID=1266666 RepID=A0A1G4KAI0_9SACH|nr:LANO_0F10704g1_1 [Lachancea nothofagi CBS 11611]